MALPLTHWPKQALVQMGRVSPSTIKTGRKSYNQNFSDNYNVNHLIKIVEWRDSVMDDNVILQELQNCLYLNYTLHHKVSTSLVASYQTWAPCDFLDHNNNKAIKYMVKIDDRDEKLLLKMKIRATANGKLRKLTMLLCSSFSLLTVQFSSFGGFDLVSSLVHNQCDS
jgi:hypothetical protein